MKKLITLIFVIFIVGAANAQDIMGSNDGAYMYLMKGHDSLFLRMGVFESWKGKYRRLFEETVVKFILPNGEEVRLTGIPEGYERYTMPDGKPGIKGTLIVRTTNVNVMSVTLPVSEEQILKMKDGIAQIKVNTIFKECVFEYKLDDANPGKKLYENYLNIKDF